MIKLKQLLESSARDRLKGKVKSSRSSSLSPFKYRPDQQVLKKVKWLFHGHNAENIGDEYGKFHRRVVVENPPRGKCLYFLLIYLEEIGEHAFYLPNMFTTKVYYPILVSRDSEFKVFIPLSTGTESPASDEEINQFNEILHEIEDDLYSVIRKNKDKIPEYDPVAGMTFILTYLKGRGVVTLSF
jgi:hypothetical protein